MQSKTDELWVISDYEKKWFVSLHNGRVSFVDNPNFAQKWGNLDAAKNFFKHKKPFPSPFTKVCHFTRVFSTTIY